MEAVLKGCTSRALLLLSGVGPGAGAIAQAAAPTDAPPLLSQQTAQGVTVFIRGATVCASDPNADESGCVVQALLYEGGYAELLKAVWLAYVLLATVGRGEASPFDRVRALPAWRLKLK